MSTDKSRCLYENDDILVIHQFVTYGSGDTDAVMSVFSQEGRVDLAGRKRARRQCRHKFATAIIQNGKWWVIQLTGGISRASLHPW